MLTLPPPRPARIVYPDSDGKPSADNTKQFRWIQVLAGNLMALFAGALDVFVAGDLFWYPVESFPDIVNAPDVMVVFGRPKGDRGSYRQWEEGGVAPQVVFEVLSPGNDHDEMARKLEWYQEYGVEEYYVYNPDSDSLFVYLRKADLLAPTRTGKQFVSPLLKIRFDLTGSGMVVFRPDGKPFLTFEELMGERDQTEKLARRLAELVRASTKGQATAEEMQELARLVEQLAPPAP